MCPRIHEGFNRKPTNVTHHMLRCLWLQGREEPKKREHVLFCKTRSPEVGWFQGSFQSTTVLSRNQFPCIFPLCNVDDSLPSCKMVVETQCFYKGWFPAMSFSQAAKQNTLHMSLARVMSFIHV